MTFWEWFVRTYIAKYIDKKENVVSEDSGIDRLEAVNKIIDGLKRNYPTAKRVKADIYFEWQETSQTDIDNELCPVVKLEIEQ